MGKIYVSETDNSIYSNSNTSENVVYIPGNSIDGPIEPTLLNSFEEFKNKFGSQGCYDNPIIFDCVSEILLAGFKVLFHRITNKSDVRYDSDYTTATNIELQIGTNKIINVKMSYKNVGTNGNNYKIRFVYKNGLILRVYYKNESTARESIRLSNSNADKKIELLSILRKLSRINSNSTEDYDNNTVLSKYVDFYVCKDNGKPATEAEIDDTYLDDVFTDIDSIVLGSETNSIIKADDGTKKVGDETIVYYNLSGGTDLSYDDLKKILEQDNLFDDYYSELKDKYTYSIKFITSGGVTTTDTFSNDENKIYSNLNSLAKSRGDCLAILDPQYDYGIEDTEIPIGSNVEYDFSCMYAPWSYTKLNRNNSYKWMPPSCIFLCTLASYVKDNSKKLYDIPAGVKMSNRNITNSKLEIGESVLDKWQNGDISINPIMKLKNYGYVIYGQKTLKRVDSSIGEKSLLQQVSVRIALNEVKREIFNICLELSFEENIYEVWEDFKIMLADRILDDLVVANRITNYDIVLGYNNDNKLEVVGDVILYFNSSLEYFNINVSVNNADIDNQISVEESYISSENISTDDIDE